MKKRLYLSAVSVSVSGLLMLLAAGTFFVRQELSYASGNTYAREHISEHILFTLRNNVLPLVLMDMAATVPAFFLAELFFRKKNVRPETLAKLQIIVTPIIVTVLFTIAVIIYTLANFTLEF